MTSASDDITGALAELRGAGREQALEKLVPLLYAELRTLARAQLQDRIAEGKLPAAEAARIALECARALAAAHAVSVVHRDIKPAKILLDANGNATVTDFGIALVTRDRRVSSSDRPPAPALHEPRAVARRANRGTLGCLRVRCRALRNAHGHMSLPGAQCDGSDRETHLGTHPQAIRA